MSNRKSHSFKANITVINIVSFCTMLSFELLFSVSDLVTFMWPFPFKVIFKDTQKLFDIGIVFDNKYMCGGIFFPS